MNNKIDYTISCRENGNFYNLLEYLSDKEVVNVYMGKRDFEALEIGYVIYKTEKV